MLTLNGKKFACNEAEFKGSLFESGGTCVGYYKPGKRSIMILDHNKEKIGVICNKVLASATKTEGGWWYNYATPKLLGDYPTRQYHEDIEAIYTEFPMPVIV